MVQNRREGDGDRPAGTERSTRWSDMTDDEELTGARLTGLGTMLRHGNSIEREKGTRRIHLGYRLKPRWREWARWLDLTAGVDSAAVRS